MATNVTYNGVTYSVPQNGNSGWGTQLTAYLVALASGSLTKAGGVVTLTANLDLGANYGIKSIFFSDRGTAASAGIFRLSNNTAVSWRNAANDGNLDLTVNASNALLFNSLPIAALALGAANTVLKMNSGGTAFEYGTLVNANINASAAIAYSKLAALTSANILVGSAANVATSVAMTGDVTISNAGVTAIASIANLAGTGDRLVQASSTGVLSASLGVSSGTYTPTFTLSNATNGIARQNNYTRIGNIVHVTGVIDGITTTTTATDVSITLTSLPVATANFSSAYQATGSGKYGRSTGGINEAMSINANSGAQTVVLQVESTLAASAGGSCFAYYSFSYQIQ